MIGLRCLAFIEPNLKLEINQTILWTDSQCVLHWIRSAKPLTTFVQNRVNEIKRHDNVELRYVSTQENPADIASRGIKTSELKSDHLWWNGPKWLMMPQEQWPTWSNDIQADNELAESEIKKCRQIELVVGEPPTGSDNQTPFGIKCENYSNLNKLLRITAWAMRFIRKLRKEAVSGPLTSKEIDEAKLKWLKCIQSKHFANEIQYLNDKKSNNMIRQLRLVLVDKGLIRCVGRLQYAQISEDSRQPILIPKSDTFTKLLIDSYHRRLMHVGVAQTLSQIRQKYWIPQGRSTVRKVLKQCRNCVRYEGGPYKMPLMPPLPSKRVSECIPFTFTGIDYFGPLYVKIDSKLEKVWVCLYTCLVVRAIHLELMFDMTTTQFLLGFRRFVARCGTPKQVISDNAQQFKTARNVIHEVWNDVISDSEILNYVSDKGIEWKFIVELAPWMGGLYERLVGLVKRSLRKTIGKVCLTAEQLRTLLFEVEAVVNSRPLVYIGKDINSQDVLTPSCFMTLNRQIGIPERDDDNDDQDFKLQMSTADNLLEVWKKGQKHLNRFWKIWRDDYLLSLRERTSVKLKEKRVRSHHEANIGDIVLVKDDLPRGTWKIGKILELPVSSDGQVRSAKILLPTSKILNRTLNFLYPLECNDEKLDNDHDIEPTKQNSELKCNDSRPKRLAAEKARENIRVWTRDDEH